MAYHRNNFGGNFGGPIKQDKAFFFFSYGGLRQVVGQALSGGLVPTAAERLGDFTADTFTVYAPGTLTQVEGTNTSPNCQTPTLNCIPSDLLDVATSKMDDVKNSIRSFRPVAQRRCQPSKRRRGLHRLLHQPDNGKRIPGQV